MLWVGVFVFLDCDGFVKKQYTALCSVLLCMVIIFSLLFCALLLLLLLFGAILFLCEMICG